MKLGRVIGQVWSTRKAESLREYKLLVVKPLYNGNAKDVIVADNLDAGIGDLVITIGGSGARRADGNNMIPISTAVVGIVDEDKAAALISEEEEKNVW
ncbi:MAG: EutN/CcmL family microcompartment protein [Eubacteriales bacterium]|jgi:ethanolamine utilization protein EutN|nr:EutN/CcmL family microcompartment protein [Eubacteriales bacterium]